MKEYLLLIGSIFGIIAGLTAGYLFLKKEWKAHVNKRNHFYNGNWNNQGQIINVPSHYVDIDGGAGGNKFNGNFNVRNSADEHSWEMFAISGKRRYGKIKCKILKTKNGKDRVVATGTLKKSETVLKWKLIKSGTDQFPKEVLLRRGLPKIG